MRSPGMSLDEARRFGAVVSFALLLSCTGCADTSVAQAMNAPRATDAAPAASAPTPARRSNVPTPFITLSPSTVAVLPGARVQLTAMPGGGEAILFSVDWRVQEGAAGGTVDAVAARQPDGSYAATYTAPMDGEGTYHVKASLREYPAASATTTVSMVRRKH